MHNNRERRAVLYVGGLIMDGEMADMDVWKEKVQQDINELKHGQSQIKNDQTTLKDDVAALKMNDKLQDQEINTLKLTLSEIKEDTNWIRRKITGAIITATITAVVAGVIGIAIRSEDHTSELQSR